MNALSLKKRLQFLFCFCKHLGGMRCLQPELQGVSCLLDQLEPFDGADFGNDGLQNERCDALAS